MRVSINHIIAGIIVVVLLVAGNVYQWNNPTILEVPEYVQTPIDSTAWVQRTAYLDRGAILDSLRQVNDNLAGRIRESQDDIASYTEIVGELRTEIDSLSSRPIEFDVRNYLDSVTSSNQDPFFDSDTSFAFTKTFGNGLFQIDSSVRISPLLIDNDLSISQLRPIRLSVVSTLNDDRSRILTYVSSQDFENLNYQSYTDLTRRKQLPWFWIGLGSGFVGATIILK